MKNKVGDYLSTRIDQRNAQPNGSNVSVDNQDESPAMSQDPSREWYANKSPSYLDRAQQNIQSQAFLMPSTVASTNGLMLNVDSV